ncbi:MAG TPA: endonuclease/exonuclease/phosphatase family protein [Candidatus Bathyarchaeia archaeon]|nr:endonuclease/exonuclease/phosphatase family protein [Candidatus Bathyarchaeia archaeon]
MRAACLICLAAGLVVNGGALAEPALTVMSFNVRYGTADDGENHWDKRKDVLVEAIRAHAPDVMGTQECLEFQAKYIAEKLPEYAWIGVGREKNGKGEMMAVFYKKDTLAVEESGHYWLSETPDVPGSMSWNTACTRMVTWARLKHTATGRTFYYANTHFDHVSDLARVNAAKLMTSRLPQGETVIVTGDFNAVAERSTCWETFKECGFADAWLAASEKSGPTVTCAGFGPPGDRRDRRIDWILYKGDVTVQKMETSLFNKDGRYPSDHYPVVATLALK